MLPNPQLSEYPVFILTFFVDSCQPKHKQNRPNQTKSKQQ